MSWSIHLVKNTVKISKAVAKNLFAAQKSAADDGECEIWYELDEVAPDGYLEFNSDHMEHMDFLHSNNKIVDILKKAKVKGDICFADFEGDNSGNMWGYRFDGKGGMEHLTGDINWSVCADSNENKEVNDAM